MASVTALRLPDGRRADRILRVGAQVELYAEVCHAGGSGLVEVVAGERLRNGRLRMRRRDEASNYLPAGEREALHARALALGGQGYEVFCTPAVLGRAEPGNDAVGEARVCWVDIDDPQRIEWLRAFARRPHMVVRSGGSGGVHAYWRLAEPVGGQRVEELNRRLGAHLGADMASSNRGRIMRLPGTENRKTSPPYPCEVAMADLARAPYEAEELVAGFPDPAERVPEPVRRSWTRAVDDDPLAEVAPPAYFARILGIEVPADGGEVRCPNPAHGDRHPSCRVFPQVGEGFYCFACGAGGNVVDLVSLIGGGPVGRALRGAEFLEAKEAALRQLGFEREAERLRARASEAAGRGAGSARGPGSPRPRTQGGPEGGRDENARPKDRGVPADAGRA